MKTNTMNVICILMGGPEFRISVGGKIRRFEDHPYCGPTALDRQGEPLSKQSAKFLYAVTQWCAQGKRVEDGLCVWDHEPKPILKHLGGRNYQIIGEEPGEKGS